MIGKLGVTLHLVIQGLLDRFLAFFYKRRFGSCGKNIMIKPMTSNFKGIENIHLGSNIRIARYAVIYATNANVYFGSNIGIAPFLSIMSGNHSTGEVGRFMFNHTVAEKEKGHDKDVVLEDDLWFGIHVTILSGVTVGRGSAIGAGAVVNKSLPPYSVVAGVPAKVIRFRFRIDEIIEHEKILYPESKRFTRSQLLSIQESYPLLQS